MIYGVPMGCDFVKEAAIGLLERHKDPLELGQVTIVVNGDRFRRRLQGELKKITQILPKILTIDGLVSAFLPIEKSNNDAARANEVLILGAMLSRLADASSPQLFHPNHRFEIAYSLLDLLDQTVERELAPDALVALELEEFAEHWKLNTKFFELLSAYWSSAQTRSKMYRDNEALNALFELWSERPHQNPVYVIGSTGSRPLMRRAMRAIQNLPAWGIVVPSVDFEMTGKPPADHPQFGARDLCEHMGVEAIENWNGKERSFAKYVRLALAPAPTTDRWLENLEMVKQAIKSDTIDLTFMNAKNRHEEAKALSVRIHQAVMDGQKVVLVSSDRILVRAVCHRLDALDIEFDDSSGIPLAQTPIGVLLRMILDFDHTKRAPLILPLLAHPFVAKANRAEHLAHLRFFDKSILRRYPGLRPWQLASKSEDENFKNWSDHWASVAQEKIPEFQTLKNWVEWHIARLENFMGKIEKLGETQDILDQMRIIASDEEEGISLSFEDYTRFWNAWLARESVQSSQLKSSPDVKILGTIEARAECADIVIQAGMNEGLWPSPSIPDMWLNRELREQLGLETPERFVGLAAHDFISGMATKNWIISRSTQADGAPTIESRFVTRMKTLLQGADFECYKAAQKRGDDILKIARSLDVPKEVNLPTPRPALRVPTAFKPTSISATQLEKYVKNPYRYFVEVALGLQPIDQPSEEIRANVQGDIWHEIFETYTKQYPAPMPFQLSEFETTFRESLKDYEFDGMAQFNFDYECSKLAPIFAEDETQRREWADKILAEHWVDTKVTFGTHEVELKAKIDRVDLDKEGSWRVYDYKSGSSSPYNKGKISNKDAQQVQLGSYILNAKGYQGDCDKAEVILYKPKKNGVAEVPVDNEIFADELAEMFEAYFDHDRPWHINPDDSFSDDINHFARYGEWYDEQEAQVVELKL